MENLGFMAAIGAALCWGTFMVPFKKSKSLNLVQFQAVMAVGIGISGLIASLILGYSLSLNIYGLISGFLWASGNMVYLIAISNLGLSKAVPLVSSLVIIGSFLWGILVFHELTSGLLLGFVGVGLIVLGVIIVSMTNSSEVKNMKKGLLAAACSGLIFGSQLAPLKIGSVLTKDFFFSICLGILITGIIIFVMKKSKLTTEAVGASLSSGVIWNIGNLLSLISLSIIGLSKMSPVSQSATLIAVAWGLFYFKEITQPKQKLQILIGAVVLFGGVIVLGLA